MAHAVQHPTYGAPLPTGRITLTNGVVFRPYKAAPRLTVRCSDDHRITIIPQALGWLAFIDQRPVIDGKTGERLRFSSREEAERTTASLAKQPRTPTP
jgi:hypothetical protein